MILPGDIGFGGKREGFYPSAVRWFTGSKWSHNFVVMPGYLGEISVLEADLKVQLVPYHKEYVEKDNDYFEIWRPIRATQEEVTAACKRLYRTDAAEIYGFLSILWFAIRQGLFKIGIRLPGKNWFPDGEICSETLWQYLYNLGGEYQKAVELLGENECSPEDLYRVVRERNDLFTIIFVRD